MSVCNSESGERGGSEAEHATHPLLIPLHGRVVADDGVVRVNLLPSQRRLHEVVAGGHHGARAEPSLLHVREKARGVPVRRQRAHPLLYPVLHDGEQRVALPD